MKTRTTITFDRRPNADRKDGSPRYVLTTGDGDTVEVRRGVPDGWPLPRGAKPRFSLYAEGNASVPLAVVVRDGQRLAVFDSGHHLLAELRLPPKKQRWRPAHEIHLPDGGVIRGREGTVPSLVLWVLLLPLVVLYYVVIALSDSPAGTLSSPLRTAWKPVGGTGGGTVMTESARGRFRVRGDRLDRRIGYAQAVAKYWRG
ncbi:hypothetical protein [Streptomyces sp. NPDC003077]|uniref:hypothetical protein n=1 Tax=Streptomyces sp. NPDC003077 TaxID=3154443 RepID=UPI0033B7A4B1